MICEHLNGKRGAVEVVSPGLQGVDDGKEFPVVDVVVAFGGDERLGEIRARMSVTIGVGLEEDCARGILRGICGNGEGFGEVREVEDGSREEEVFQLVEGLLTSGGPVPAVVFLGQVEKGAGNCGIVRYEPMAEVGKDRKSTRLNSSHRP